jgi:hypothetical protein
LIPGRESEGDITTTHALDLDYRSYDYEEHWPGEWVRVNVDKAPTALEGVKMIALVSTEHLEQILAHAL